MELKIQNRHLPDLIEFLESMKLKPTLSRARSRLLEQVSAAYTAFMEAQIELVSQYAKCDEQGKPIVTSEGTFEIVEGGDVNAYREEEADLLAETALIPVGSYVEHAKTFRQALEEYDEPLSGQAAFIYDLLCDQFESEASDE